jgi:PHD/YefM family antitoxin component YafN of YafNO toxin-antitoxin module
VVRIFDRVEDRPRLLDALPRVSTSELVAAMSEVTSAVAAHGAVLVTRHDKPTMVLLSIERYRELARASEPDLDALSRRFDALVAQMQGPEAERRMAEAFAMTPEQLGEAARQAERK